MKSSEWHVLHSESKTMKSSQGAVRRVRVFLPVLLSTVS